MIRYLNPIIYIIIISISFSLVGCTSNSEGLSPNTTQVITPEQLNEVEIATRIAEEKIVTIFEEYQPENIENTYYVGKNRYSSIENIAVFLNLYYSEEMTNSIIENYIKVEEVPGLGISTTLNLPENYLTITGHELDSKDSIRIYDNEATITVNIKDEQVTYSLIKLDNKWLVTGKAIK